MAESKEDRQAFQLQGKPLKDLHRLVDEYKIEFGSKIKYVDIFAKLLSKAKLKDIE